MKQKVASSLILAAANLLLLPLLAGTGIGISPHGVRPPGSAGHLYFPHTDTSQSSQRTRRQGDSHSGRSHRVGRV